MSVFYIPLATHCRQTQSIFSNTVNLLSFRLVLAVSVCLCVSLVVNIYKCLQSTQLCLCIFEILLTQVRPQFENQCDIKPISLY